MARPRTAESRHIGPPLPSRRGGLLGLAFAGLTALMIGVAVLPAAVSKAQSTSPEAMCGRGDWNQIAGPGARSHVSILATTHERLYAAGVADSLSADPSHASWTMRLDESSLQPLAGALAGRQLSALLATPDDAEQLAWAAGFGNDTIYAAAPDSPASFSPRGSLDAWPMQLLAARGQVFAAFGRSGESGVYRWDGSDWALAGGEDIEPVNTAPLSFWSSARGNGKLWLGTEQRGLWSAPEDDASPWTWEGDDELGASTVTALAIDPLLPDRMAAGLGPKIDDGIDYRGLRRSADGGATWSRPSFAAGGVYAPELVSALAYSHVLSGTLVAAVYGHGLHVSRDAGQHWHRLLPPSNTTAHEDYFSALATALPLDRPGCELLFAGGQSGVWVRDLATLPAERRIYIPWTNQARGDDTGLSFLSLPQRPPATPTAPRLSLPRD